MIRQSVLSIILVTVLQKSAQSPLADLKSVVVLYRHGDRSPHFIYPTDPYDVSYWPDGIGGLTNIGKNQQYELGKWFRNRYSKFLPRRYDSSDIEIRSSNVNRCLMSSAANLAGLYPPVPDQIWNKKLLWQPMPIHTTPEEEDRILAQGAPCPRYSQLYNELMETDEFVEFFQDNAEFFEYLSEHSGIPVTNIETMYILYDTLFIENLYNLTLPEWAQEVFFAEDQRFKKLSQAFWTPFTQTPELARLKAGPLIDLITSQFENVTDGTGTPKFLMLSAHDSTVASLLNSLNIFDNQSPPYAATVILELRESKRRQFVNIFYKKFDTVTKLTLPGCDFNCDLGRFRKIVQPLRISSREWEEECQVS